MLISHTLARQVAAARPWLCVLDWRAHFTQRSAPERDFLNLICRPNTVVACSRGPAGISRRPSPGSGRSISGARIRTKDGLHNTLGSRKMAFPVLPNALGSGRLERGDDLTNAMIHCGEFASGVRPGGCRNECEPSRYVSCREHGVAKTRPERRPARRRKYPAGHDPYHEAKGRGPYSSNERKWWDRAHVGCKSELKKTFAAMDAARSSY
jgi:hypothetical protein